jgi:two-component system, chemotaxis family, protein-glutamate methylesterase/glutaminase
VAATELAGFSKNSRMSYELVAMGGSWGGLAAYDRILPALPEGFPAAIVVVQHRAVDSYRGGLTSYLQQRSALPVREIDDKEPIEPGALHLAPADYHTIVERGYFALSTEAAVHYSRPSIDVCFQTAADAYGERLIGVVLTGANEDGAAGIVAIHERGGYTIAQDPATADKPAMPEAAIATGAVDRVASVEEIGPLLVELCAAPESRSVA